MSTISLTEGRQSMALAAPAQYQTNKPNEMNSSQIPQEDMEKLQEIHELINLLFTELTTRSPQSLAMPYTTTGMMPTMPSAPYTHSLLRYAWGMAPYFRTPGF
jgi:hypothetical protein